MNAVTIIGEKSIPSLALTRNRRTNPRGFWARLLCLGLLAAAAVLHSGCLIAAAGTAVSCAAEGGDGYRTRSDGVELGRCDLGEFQGLKVCEVKGADPGSFRSLGRAAGAWWGVDDRAVFRGCLSFSIDPAKFGQPRSLAFQSRETEFVVAGSYVFWRGHLLEAADGHSFEAISQRYGRDGAGVWMLDKHLEGADPQTFRVLADVPTMPQIGADDSLVFVRGESHDLPDARTLTPLGEPTKESFYFRDAHRVYWGARVLEGADPETMVLLDRGWARDRERVFRRGEVVPGADPETLVVEPSGMASDRNGLIQKSGERSAADPATYKYWKGPFWRDSKDVWVGGNALGLGRQTSAKRIAYKHWSVGGHVVACSTSPQCCSVLEGVEARDVASKDLPYIVGRSVVLFRGQPATGVDASSFEHLFGDFGRDRQGLIWKGVRVPGADLESFERGRAALYDDEGRLTVGRDHQGAYKMGWSQRPKLRLFCPDDEMTPCATQIERGLCQ